MHFGSGHSLDDPARNYKHPTNTKLPSFYEGIADQLLRGASRIC